MSAAAIRRVPRRKLNDAVDTERTAVSNTSASELCTTATAEAPTLRQVSRPAILLDARRGGLERHAHEAIELYQLFPRSTTCPVRPLFNAARCTSSSRVLLAGFAGDSLEAVYDKYKTFAVVEISGASASRGTRTLGGSLSAPQRLSNGIVPWLKSWTLGAGSIKAASAKARCVYWRRARGYRAFLELRDNTGDDARRTHHLNLGIGCRLSCSASRAARTGRCSIQRLPEFRPVGEHSRMLHSSEAAGLRGNSCPRANCMAHDAHARADRQRLDDFQGQGNGLQPNRAGRIGVHCRTCDRNPGSDRRRRERVCNLGSINLARHLAAHELISTAGPDGRACRAQLDRVIDMNFYPLASQEHRTSLAPGGLGLMACKMFLPPARPSTARPLVRCRGISEAVYFHALRARATWRASADPIRVFRKPAPRGELQFDSGITPENADRWRLAARNSSAWTAQQPADCDRAHATIASIAVL